MCFDLACIYCTSRLRTTSINAQSLKPLWGGAELYSVCDFTFTIKVPIVLMNYVCHKNFHFSFFLCKRGGVSFGFLVYSTAKERCVSFGGFYSPYTAVYGKQNSIIKTNIRGVKGNFNSIIVWCGRIAQSCNFHFVIFSPPSFHPKLGCINI